MATRPASTMTIERTAAKTGRSMKNFEITGLVPSLQPAGRRPGLAHRRHRLHWCAGTHADDAVDDDAVAGLAGRFSTTQPSSTSRSSLTGRTWAVLLASDDVDERALAAPGRPRCLGHHDGVRHASRPDFDAHELARQQAAVVVGEDGADLDRAGPRVHDSRLRAILPSAGDRLRCRTAARPSPLRACRAPLMACRLAQLAVGGREVDVGRIELRDAGQHRLLRLHQRAFRRRHEPCQARDGRLMPCTRG